MLSIRALSLPTRLRPFTLDIERGALIHLVGPNGAGKSTLLALLAGMLSGDGDVQIEGKPLAHWQKASLARVRSYLSQQASRAAGMPVWHYLSLHQLSSAAGHEAHLQHYLEALQLTDKLARPLSQLSGGEWQRVRLAAAFLQISQPEGRLLLLDEPLTGLDVAQQAAFDRLLPPLLASGITIIMSSHDLNHTLRHAHQAWLMGQGEVKVWGTASDVLVPERLSEIFGVTFRQAAFAGQQWILNP